MGHPNLDHAGRTFAQLEQARKDRDRALRIGHALFFAVGTVTGILLAGWIL